MIVEVEKVDGEIISLSRLNHAEIYNSKALENLLLLKQNGGSIQVKDNDGREQIINGRDVKSIKFVY